jgi:hypothetical protein
MPRSVLLRNHFDNGSKRIVKTTVKERTVTTYFLDVARKRENDKIERTTIKRILRL